MTPNPKKPTAQSFSILLVEDDVGLCVRLAKMLSVELSVDVDYEHTMEGARARFTDLGRYDLVILDVVLPETAEDVAEIKRIDADLDNARRRIEDAYAFLGEESVSRGADDLKNALDVRSSLCGQREERLNSIGGVILAEELARADTAILPVLFLTAVGSHDAKERAGRALHKRRIHWAVKPLQPDRIVDLCRILLEP